MIQFILNFLSVGGVPKWSGTVMGVLFRDIGFGVGLFLDFRTYNWTINFHF